MNSSQTPETLARNLAKSPLTTALVIDYLLCVGATKIADELLEAVDPVKDKIIVAGNERNWVRLAAHSLQSHFKKGNHQRRGQDELAMRSLSSLLDCQPKKTIQRPSFQILLREVLLSHLLTHFRSTPYSQKQFDEEYKDIFKSKKSKLSIANELQDKYKDELKKLVRGLHQKTGKELSQKVAKVIGIHDKRVSQIVSTSLEPVVGALGTSDLVETLLTSKLEAVPSEEEFTSDSTSPSSNSSSSAESSEESGSEQSLEPISSPAAPIPPPKNVRANAAKAAALAQKLPEKSSAAPSGKATDDAIKAKKAAPLSSTLGLSSSKSKPSAKKPSSSFSTSSFEEEQPAKQVEAKKTQNSAKTSVAAKKPESKKSSLAKQALDSSSESSTSSSAKPVSKTTIKRGPIAKTTIAKKTAPVRNHLSDSEEESDRPPSAQPEKHMHTFAAHASSQESSADSASSEQSLVLQTQMPKILDSDLDVPSSQKSQKVKPSSSKMDVDQPSSEEEDSDESKSDDHSKRGQKKTAARKHTSTPSDSDSEPASSKRKENPNAMQVDYSSSEFELSDSSSVEAGSQPASKSKSKHASQSSQSTSGAKSRPPPSQPAQRKHTIIIESEPASQEPNGLFALPPEATPSHQNAPTPAQNPPEPAADASANDSDQRLLTTFTILQAAGLPTKTLPTRPPNTAPSAAAAASNATSASSPLPPTNGDATAGKKRSATTDYTHTVLANRKQAKTSAAAEAPTAQNPAPLSGPQSKKSNPGRIRIDEEDEVITVAAVAARSDALTTSASAAPLATSSVASSAASNPNHAALPKLSGAAAANASVAKGPREPLTEAENLFLLEEYRKYNDYRLILQEGRARGIFKADRDQAQLRERIKYLKTKPQYKGLQSAGQNPPPGYGQGLPQ